MSKMIRFAMPLIAAAMMTAPAMVSAQSPQQGAFNNNAQTQDWATPPAGTEQAQAYRDGIQAAQLDTVAKRPVDPKASYLYNHPPVKKAQTDAYRSAFTQGYQTALKHQNGQQPGE